MEALKTSIFLTVSAISWFNTFIINNFSGIFFLHISWYGKVIVILFYLFFAYISWKILYIAFSRKAFTIASKLISSNILLLVSFLNSLLASINRILFSALFLANTSIQVAIEVPKNRFSGSCITESIKFYPLNRIRGIGYYCVKWFFLYDFKLAIFSIFFKFFWILSFNKKYFSSL